VARRRDGENGREARGCGGGRGRAGRLWIRGRRRLDSRCEEAVFAHWIETDPAQSSLQQYVGLTSGVRNPATVDDCSPSAGCRSTDDNIFRQVRLSGGTARSYVDGATRRCSAQGNAAKHVPAMYFVGTYEAGGTPHSDAEACATEVRPLAELDVDALPTFAMVTPDLCHDGHDCPNADVDRFAHTVIEPILASRSYAQGRTALMVLYDEDSPVPNLLVAPTAVSGVVGAAAGHTAMLRTWEEMLGLPVLHQEDLAGVSSLRGPAHI
jgi:hypothetical protein